MAAIAAPQEKRIDRFGLLWAVVGVCWLIIVVADAIGAGALLHHDALIEHGPPLAVAAGVFSVGWMVMIGAMMLPASVPAIAAYRAERVGADSGPTVVAFVSSYLAIWLAVGVACLLGDVLLHQFVDSTPWLAARPWLIEAGAVALAGAYQFTPMKRRALDACRHPSSGAHTGGGGTAAGVRHAIDCLVASGPLMLLMFAAGFANLPWMVALAALMTYEARGTRGHTVAKLAGFGLLYLGLFALTNQGLPAW